MSVNDLAMDARGSPPGLASQGAPDTLRRQAVDRGMQFLLSRGGDRGIEPATVSLAGAEPLTGADLRSQIRRQIGVDIGVDPADEAFSAMMALALLRSPQTLAEREKLRVLHERVQGCRWQHRYRFFYARSGFASDTDCTAVTAAALRATGYCTDRDLDTYARVLLTAASPGLSRTFRWEDEVIKPGRVMVYWEDDAEPGAGRRGRKFDPAVCANVQYVLEDATIPGRAHPLAVAANRACIAEHLTSGRYLTGTRYYRSPASFLYALSRLCAAFPDRYRTLVPALDAAVAAAATADPLSLALNILAADNTGCQAGQDERRTTLMSQQRPDGSWPFCPLYRLGRYPVYFGSPDITTLVAVKALDDPNTRARH
jgi:hypothetical protein